jgi:low temperature requirement protein LtrA
MSSAPRESSPTVSWFELFYDLVVVAAVSLTNDAFLDNLTAETARAALIGILALSWVWLLTTLFNNVYPGQDLIRRLLMLVQTAAIVTAALAIDQDSEMEFRTALVAYAIALLIVVLLILNDRLMRKDRHHGSLLRETAIVPVTSAAVVCLVGAAVGGDHLTWFLIAALLVSIVPILAWQYRRWLSDGRLRLDHMRERLGLFVLIILGEGFAQMVSALHSLGSIPRGGLFGLTFLVSFALWWIYFDGTFTEGIDLGHVRWRLSLLGHLTLIYGIGGTLDILALLTAQREDMLGPAVVDYFTVCIAVVLFSFALLRFAAKGHVGGPGVLHIVSGVAVICLGVALEEPGMGQMPAVVSICAVVVIGNGLASAWVDRSPAGGMRSRFSAVLRGVEVE